VAFQVALIADEQPPPVGARVPRATIPDAAAPELNIPVMSNRTAWLENALPMIGIGFEGVTTVLPVPLPLQPGVVEYIVNERLIDVTVLPVTTKEIGKP
jgi:hypothetical protein